MNSQLDSNEFFKLEEIDRRVLFWIISNERLRASLASWLEYIYKDYYRRHGLALDISSILNEVTTIIDDKSVMKNLC